MESPQLVTALISLLPWAVGISFLIGLAIGSLINSGLAKAFHAVMASIGVNILILIGVIIYQLFIVGLEVNQVGIKTILPIALNLGLTFIVSLISCFLGMYVRRIVLK